MADIIDITEWVRPAQPLTVVEAITGRSLPPVFVSDKADQNFRAVAADIALLMEDYCAHGGSAFERAHALTIKLYKEGRING